MWNALILALAIGTGRNVWIALMALTGLAAAI